MSKSIELQQTEVLLEIQQLKLEMLQTLIAVKQAASIIPRKS